MSTTREYEGMGQIPNLYVVAITETTSGIVMRVRASLAFVASVKNVGSARYGGDDLDVTWRRRRKIECKQIALERVRSTPRALSALRTPELLP